MEDENGIGLNNICPPRILHVTRFLDDLLASLRLRDILFRTPLREVRPRGVNVGLLLSECLDSPRYGLFDRLVEHRLPVDLNFELGMESSVAQEEHGVRSKIVQRSRIRKSG